jgi:hypothetical protein
MPSVVDRRRLSMQVAKRHSVDNINHAPLPTAFFGPDLPSICLPRETDTSSSSMEEDEESSKSQNSSYKSQSSFFIPGITARARCLEDDETEQKLSARSLYVPAPSTPRSARRPRYISTMSSDTRSIDEEEVSCFDDDLDLARDLVISTTVICKKDKRRRNKPTKRSSNSDSVEEELDSVLVPQVIQTKEIIETNVDGKVETSDASGWTSYLDTFKDEQEKFDAKGSSILQSQLTSIRDLIQAQKERIQTSFREEVAKTA